VSEKRSVYEENGLRLKRERKQKGKQRRKKADEQAAAERMVIGEI
jgi:hypothetical protein